MKLHILPFLAAIKLAHAGWKLDHRTCTGADADLVNKIMVSAFELAGHGLTAVDNILNNGNDNGNSDNVNNVVKWMFFKDDEQVTDTAMKSPRLKKVQDTLAGLGAVSTRNDNEANGGNTIIVYCGVDTSDDRFEAVNWPDGTFRGYRDADSLRFYSSPQEYLKGCHDYQPTTAYAMAGDDVDNTPSQIQICPFFLDWMKNGDTGGGTQPHPQTLPDLIQPKSSATWWPFDNDKRKSVFYNSLTKAFLAKKVSVLKPIDVFSLFDKVLLHELTHTLPGKQTLDVDEHIGILTGTKYGWNRCRKLAQENPNEPVKDKDGDVIGYRAANKNADSIALMCSAVTMLVAEDTIVSEITEDGQVNLRQLDD